MAGDSPSSGSTASHDHCKDERSPGSSLLQSPHGPSDDGDASTTEPNSDDGGKQSHAGHKNASAPEELGALQAELNSQSCFVGQLKPQSFPPTTVVAPSTMMDRINCNRVEFRKRSVLGRSTRCCASCGLLELPGEIDFYHLLGARQFSRLRVACARFASYEVLVKNLLADACRPDVVWSNYILSWAPVGPRPVSERRRCPKWTNAVLRKQMVRDFAVVSASRSLRWLLRGQRQWKFYAPECIQSFKTVLATLCLSDDRAIATAAECTAGKADRMNAA
ncbi:unnamed protein product [Symbiodinium necroappetens]|uniref:Uncharacterized protein n=1 Tax=Symbiodinium necroappetens TaxID=1628268 RepID=A0A813B689_9DINO|nr:unnamed protein product [Symbiodinium necroappetens]